MKEKQLTYTLPFSKESVIDLFNDLEAYGKLHPLILSVKEIESNPIQYKITERPYKFLPFKIIYYATIHSAGNEIVYSVTGIPLSKLHIKYNLESIENGGTEINCLLQLDSKLVGKQILMNKLIKAQNDLMSSLTHYLKKL